MFFFFADTFFHVGLQTREELEKAIASHVAKAKGEPVGVKALMAHLEEKFSVEKGTLLGRKEEIKTILMAAMGGAAEEPVEEPVARARAGTASTEPVPVDEDTDKTAGKSRAGQQPDLQGYMKKRGDQGRIKMWKKRHFRLYKKEGVIAYFKSDKDTEQLGEISVTGAFLIDRREDLGKLVFTLTMKTSARIWILQAPDEPTLTQWMQACTPMLGERATAVRMGGADNKQPKPRPGLPLPFPPTYVQGWQELESSLITSAADDWTGLNAKRPVLPVKPVPGAVAITVVADGSAVVDEVREVSLNNAKEGFFNDVPAQIVPGSVTWAGTDSALVQTRFEHDRKTQHDLLRKLVGRRVTATYTNVHGQGNVCSYSGRVFYDSHDDRFALVDEATHTIHFFDLSESGSHRDHTIPGAHSLQLQDADEAKLNAGTTDAFVAPRLWSKFETTGAKVVGSLTYHVGEGSLPCNVQYAVVLSADEQQAAINGWYSVENKTSRSFHNAAITYRAGNREEKSDAEAPKEEGGDVAGAAAGLAGKGGLLSGVRALADALATPAAGERPARVIFYPLVASVSLPSRETTNAGFLSKTLPVRANHLIRFATPGFSIKPQVAKDEGKILGGFGKPDKEPEAIVSTVVRFTNPLPGALPTGNVRISRRDHSGVGALPLTESRLMRVEGGEEVTIDLGTPVGISATRRQTGYNFDAEKHFIIETFEIVIVNGRQETVNILVEDTLWRWSSWEITQSKPAHSRTSHPRKISWNVRLNYAEDITIKYSVFYTSFDLPSDYLDAE